MQSENVAHQPQQIPLSDDRRVLRRMRALRASKVTLMLTELLKDLVAM